MPAATLVAVLFATAAAHGQYWADSVIVAAAGAYPALISVARQLKRDHWHANPTVVRYFEEVTVTAIQLKSGLTNALRLLRE